MASSENNSYIVPAWEERPLCYCGDKAKVSVLHCKRYFHCPGLWPDFEPCDFEQWLDTTPLPTNAASMTQLETDAQYNIRRQEYEMMERARHTTVQQLPEREIGLKIREDELMRRRIARLRSRNPASTHRHSRTGSGSHYST